MLSKLLLSKPDLPVIIAADKIGLYKDYKINIGQLYSGVDGYDNSDCLIIDLYEKDKDRERNYSSS